jgi:radical SAM protein with 4Fe4S-binding SPASM domain
MEEWRKFCDKFVKESARHDKLFTCGAGSSSLHIDPYGLAKGCLMMRKHGFSMKEHTLKWIWESGIPSVIDQKKSFHLPCDECSLACLCGQCTAWSIVEHGDPDKEVAYLCEIAKMRAREFEFVDVHIGGTSNEKENVVST